MCLSLCLRSLEEDGAVTRRPTAVFTGESSHTSSLVVPRLCLQASPHTRRHSSSHGCVYRRVLTHAVTRRPTAVFTGESWHTSSLVVPWLSLQASPHTRRHSSSHGCVYRRVLTHAVARRPVAVFTGESSHTPSLVVPRLCLQASPRTPRCSSSHGCVYRRVLAHAAGKDIRIPLCNVRQSFARRENLKIHSSRCRLVSQVSVEVALYVITYICYDRGSDL